MALLARGHEVTIAAVMTRQHNTLQHRLLIPHVPIVIVLLMPLLTVTALVVLLALVVAPHHLPKHHPCHRTRQCCRRNAIVRHLTRRRVLF